MLVSQTDLVNRKDCRFERLGRGCAMLPSRSYKTIDDYIYLVLLTRYSFDLLANTSLLDLDREDHHATCPEESSRKLVYFDTF
jgi:hypothetical protein